MAKYIVIDLAGDIKAEADCLSSNEDLSRLKRPRQDEESSMRNTDASDKIRQLERELNEKADEMNDFITRERQSNDELQDARGELIKGWNDIMRGKHDNIGIKYIGEIDSKVFISEMKDWYSLEDPVVKGVGMCSLWQDVFVKIPSGGMCSL
ncbi:hypothetical protein C2S53_008800 [Perilla frutescens var. hirtella]|uniref:Uncharacterized protein n=1 Tax=Perilla frutescens var. hirtella TaxID=608512 RepID=A0AAD4NZL1_PERFH|nr:hypothetical protein C2S53_008800 [Perilla frutescens var. hirtella]